MIPQFNLISCSHNSLMFVLSQPLQENQLYSKEEQKAKVPLEESRGKFDLEFDIKI